MLTTTPVTAKKNKAMGKKVLKYIVVIVVVLLVAYNSVYFKKLDQVKAEQTAKTFNAASYAQNFWEKKLTPGLDKAIAIDKLIPMLNTDPTKAFDNYSHALGIGNLRYFLVQGKGQITAIDADDITVSIAELPSQKVKIATEYIFGNAARDATGLININDFNNTMDFNNVSAEINVIIRNKVLPQLKHAKVGNSISFTGAIELNKEHLNLAQIEAVPLAVNIQP
jgi:predicted lipoprotein